MKTNENGRSMIEMLGVLAIIGVLSVGGIYGYTMAMDKYKANEIIQTASMMATIAHSKDAGAGAAVSSLADAGLGTTIAGVSGLSMEASAPSGGVVVITISGAGKLCAQIDSIKPTNGTMSGYTVTCNS